MGMYISQDSIGLLGGLALYGYVGDPSGWLDVFGLWSLLLPSGFGHHLFPRSVVKKLYIKELMEKNSISWYPNKIKGSDVLYGKMHEALRAQNVPIHGSKFDGNIDDAFDRMKKAYEGFTEKGFLKIPNTDEKLFKNLTPKEAIEKIEQLYKEGKLKNVHH